MDTAAALTKNQPKAMLLGALAVLCWSTVATAFKLSLAHLAPLQLLSIATATSLFILLAVVAKRYSMRFVCEAWKAAPVQYALLGAINPFLYYVILFNAYDLLPAQQAQPLNYSWALVLSLLAVPLLGQALKRADIIALLVGFFGVIVIATRGDVLALQFDSGKGVLLALSSTVLWAVYWLYNARLKAPPEVSLLLCFIHGSPLVWGMMMFTTGLPNDWQGVTSAIYVGVFEMGITFLLWLGAMQLATHASRVSNLIFLSPFLSLLLIHWILGEDIVPATYIGLSLIIVAVIYQQVAAHRSAQ